MLSFIGKRSIIIVLIAGVAGLFLAVIEILLSAYIVKLLSLIGIGQSSDGFLHTLLGSFDNPLVILAGFVVVTMTRSVLHIAKGYLAVSANELFVTRLRLACISSTLGKIGPRHNPSHVYSLISDVFLKSALSFYGVAHAIPFVIQSLLLLVFLLSLSIHLSLVGLTFIFLVGILVTFIQKRIALIVSPLSDINDRLYQNLKRILENLLLIRFCKLESTENKHAEKLLINYLKIVRKSNFISLVSENVPLLLGSVVISILFLMQLDEPHISPELFLGFIYIFVRFVQSLSQVISFLSLTVTNWPYFMAARNYYRELPEKDIIGFDVCLTGEARRNEKGPKPDREKIKTELPLDIPPSIVATDLSCSYENGKTVVFSNLSFTIPSGAQCVIVGPSGVGKSTLLNLIVGELQPTSGEVTVNNMSPKDFLDAYSQKSAYAGPEPLLFEGGVRENLLYGVSRLVSDEEIITVLESLGLHNWLTQFGGNLSLPLGDRGVATSSGQAQRLSIARAILRKPKFLIMDEVTANLDLGSERKVLDILEYLKGNATVIIVTHSAVMMKNADVTIDLGSETKNIVSVEV